MREDDFVATGCVPLWETWLSFPKNNERHCNIEESSVGGFLRKPKPIDGILGGDGIGFAPRLHAEPFKEEKGIGGEEQEPT